MIARIEWDGPLLEREEDDIAAELTLARNEEQRSGLPRFVVLVQPRSYDGMARS